LGINSVSTKAVNGYELGLRIGLASYRVGFDVIGSDPLLLRGCTPGRPLGHGGRLLGRLGSGWLGPSRWVGWVSAH
jgi:hypothetical protein